MTDKAAILKERIHALQAELDQEFERRRKRFSYDIRRRRVVFARDIRAQHAAFKQRLSSYVGGARLLVVLTAPVIYAVIVPFVLLDIFVSLFQTICFPVYGIEKVRRRDYITFDRKHLAYLNGLEKLNCVYCAYGNGLLAYAGEIAARTEVRWCPIKHARRLAAQHRHYDQFLEYGDAEGYRKLQADRHGARE